MGVPTLWRLLDEVGLVRHCGGDSAAAQATLAREVGARALAVDLSIWMVQAQQQQALAPHFSEQERCLRVVLDRCAQCLRHGCLPVLVADGVPPEAKRGALQKRAEDRLGRHGRGDASRASLPPPPASPARPSLRRVAARHLQLSRAVAALAEALGLPVFLAPGEAEATCAALEKAGVVDGCVSADGDTALYGARRVFASLRLSAARPAESAAAIYGRAALLRALGERAGEREADGALALLGGLLGSDYHLEGAQGVGLRGAWRLARELLGSREWRELELEVGGVEEAGGAIWTLLERRLRLAPDAYLRSLTACTGCKRCGHEAHRKQGVARHTAKNPCADCAAGLEDARRGTPDFLVQASTHVLGGSSPPNSPPRAPRPPEPCLARTFARCTCAFHRLEEERAVERLLDRLRAQPGFLAAARAAASVFSAQRAEARVFVERELEVRGLSPGRRLRWSERPSMQAALRALNAGPKRGELWEAGNVRARLAPLLLEWDLGRAQGGGEAEFEAVRVVKVLGERGAGACGMPDEDVHAAARYVLEWRRLDADLERLGTVPFRPPKPRAAGKADAESQADAAPASRTELQHLPVQELDERWIAKSASEQRAVRYAALLERAPEMLEAFWAGRARREVEAEAREAAKVARKLAKEAGRGRGRGKKPVVKPGALLNYLTKQQAPVQSVQEEPCAASTPAATPAVVCLPATPNPPRAGAATPLFVPSTGPPSSDGNLIGTLLQRMRARQRRASGAAARLEMEQGEGKDAIDVLAPSPGDCLVASATPSPDPRGSIAALLARDAAPKKAEAAAVAVVDLTQDSPGTIDLRTPPSDVPQKGPLHRHLATVASTGKDRKQQEP